MKYHDIPDYTEWRAWKTADGTWETKLENRFGDVLLHLTEDPEQERIEDGGFYLDVDGGATLIRWIREREGIDMGNGIIDADYVCLYPDGEQRETQHNHVHLDHDLDEGRAVALTPI